MKRKSDSAPFYVALTLGALACLGAKYRLDARAKTWPQPRVTIDTAEYDARSARRSSLGFDNVYANLLWIELIQNASHDPLPAGESSWEFAQLNTLLTLDPKLERAYHFGASFLTVFRRDQVGARRILERWVSRRPTYWRAHYLLAFHLYTELNDYESASRAMLRASEMEGAPDWLSALGVRLISENGAPLLALQVALDLYPNLKTDDGKLRLRERVRALRLHLVKTAWQRSIDDFRKEKGRPPRDMEEVRDRVLSETRSIASATRNLTVHEDLVPIFQERFKLDYDAKEGRMIYSGPKTFGLENSGIHRMDQGK